MKFEPVIGLEVHVQVKTKSKMFCGCPADTFGKKPNSATCPVCLGLPGALPVPNRAAVEKTVLLAQTLSCKIANFSQFERKNYFYPDLPKGFQISQYSGPIGVSGSLEGTAITRVHLEEDTGKLVHEGSDTLVDFNRSGIPLIEIVTEPEFSDPGEAKSFLKELRKLVVHLGVSSADMEKGSMRLEANVSLKKASAKSLPPYKVELKNINSFAFVEKALKAEISRQEEVLAEGGTISQETRGFDEKSGKTFSQRTKEEAFDYRYFPEPDLPPLTSKSFEVAREVETPKKIRERYLDLGLSKQYAEVLLLDKELAAIFDELLDELPAKQAANIVVNKRLGDPKKLGAKGILKALEEDKKKEILSGGEVESYAEKIILDNEAAVRDYASGKSAALQFLLGQLMKETKGRIDPKEGEKVLKDLLDARAKTS